MPVIKTIKNTSVVVKVSETHDRVALVMKYANGETLKTASNRGSDTMSFSRPAGSAKVDLKPLFRFVCKPLSTKELHGDRFARLAEFFATTTSIQDAIDKVPA